MSLKRAPASRHQSAKSRPVAVTNGATVAAPIAKRHKSLHRWTFLTNHSHVLLLLSRDSSLALREVAWQVGITERAVQRILADLEADGFIVREKIGRKNHYRILTKQPLRHPIVSHRTIGDLNTLLNGTRTLRAPQTTGRIAGNVRELQSVLKYAKIQAAGEIPTVNFFPEGLRSGVSSHPNAINQVDVPSEVTQLVRRLLHEGAPQIYDEVYAAVDRIVLEEVLRHVRGHQIQAAELLGISRTTLRAKLRTLGLVVEKWLQPDSHQHPSGVEMPRSERN